MSDIFDPVLQGSHASQWTLNPTLPGHSTVSSWISFCSNNYIGGPGVLANNGVFTRIYDNLPVHNTVYIWMAVLLVDSQLNDKVHVAVSSTQPGSPTVNFSPLLTVSSAPSAWPSNYCGNPGLKENAIWVVMQVKHSASTLKLEVISDTGVGATLGLNNVNSLYSTQTIDVNWAWIISMQGPITPYTSVPATTRTATTIGCHAACTNGCFGPAATGCFWCTAGYQYNGNQCTTCLIGTYPPSCTPCPAGCAACSSPSVCTGCSPTGYYYSNLACHPCDPSCLTCSGSSPDQCLSCPPGSILFPNNTCLSSCQPPYSQVTVNSQPVCQFPCSGKSPYAFEDGTCTSQCPPSYSLKIEGSGQICVFEEARASSVDEASRNAVIGMISMGLMISMAILDPKSFIPLSSAILIKMLEYIKYIDVSHSAPLEIFLLTSKRSLLELFFDTDAPLYLKDRLVGRPLPFVLSRYGLTSSFLVNFYEDLIVFAILMGILIFCISLTSLALKNQKANFIITKTKVGIRNILLTYLYHNCGDIILFSGLEYWSSLTESVWSFFSLLLAFALGIILFAVLALNILLVRKRWAILKKQNTQELQTLNKKYEGFKVLFEDFKEHSIFQYSFLIFFVLRDMLLSLFLVSLFRYPLAQAVLITLMNILMLVYLFIYRPLKDKIHEIEQIFCEMLLLVVNMGILTLAAHDHAHSRDQYMVEVIGRMIIIMNIVFMLSILVFLIIQIAWKYHTGKKNAAKTQVPSQSTPAVPYSPMVAEPITDRDTSTLRPEKIPFKHRPKSSQFSLNSTYDKIGVSSLTNMVSGTRVFNDVPHSKVAAELQSDSNVPVSERMDLKMKRPKSSQSSVATNDKISLISPSNFISSPSKKASAKLDKSKIYPFNDTTEDKIILNSPSNVSTPVKSSNMQDTPLISPCSYNGENQSWISPNNNVVPTSQKKLLDPITRSSIRSPSQNGVDSKDKNLD